MERSSVIRDVSVATRGTPPPPAELAPAGWIAGAIGPAVRATVVTLVLTGLAYPLVVTAFARVLFPWRAGGSLVSDDSGRVVGSELIAQGFAGAAYFQPRPSAAGDKGWDAAASSGSNLGPTSRKLRERAVADQARLARENPEAPGPVPVELVTASGSGLDPHLSPAAALWQAPRVARARGVSLERVRALLHEMEEGRDFGILGEPRVNVLMLNLALDRRFGAPGGRSP
ncbi:potassium-transporting ATPase subunit KdpC [Anaeromyxobacter oryzae]|uniref:Potassium-transporting ATPase KdpC subunit n=1 Tax=Anaeromyxobacter oryzae TaxID=2918170 RepID=A0ABN6MWG0_9BACT|nr:potassium-transporting ATPase subunit KdpC [Anaeromyxobacter oryzae]BDG04154.1 potassium-transporting ATPase KdpC subunit [Anaeromyxobacter oryzae]